MIVLGCWIWPRGKTTAGYGVVRVNRKPIYVHRLTWQQYFGSIPQGMCVLHSCDNPPCFNPDHLFLGTNHDNMVDKSLKGRHHSSRKTHCPQGHAYTTNNTFIYDGRRNCRQCRLNHYRSPEYRHAEYLRWKERFHDCLGA